MLNSQSNIKRSTFTVHLKNAFLDPNGEIIKLKTHHHIEVALRILKELDEEYEEKFENAKRQVDRYQRMTDAFKSISSPIDWKEVDKVHRIFFPKDNLSFENYEDLDELLEEWIKYYQNETNVWKNCVKNNSPKYLSNFQRSNKNRGYDSAEYLVIVLGYVAIEDGYVIYNPRKISNSQAKVLKCFKTKDEETGLPMFVPKSASDIRLEKKKFKEKLIKKAKWFDDYNNRFHYPTGYKTFEFNRWIEQCYEYGLNPYQLLKK